MHKLPIAATLAALAAAGGIAVVAATRSAPVEASASHTDTAPAAAPAAPAHSPHASELETATGTGNDPQRCATDYAALCASEGWSLDRRACALAADDLMNAHLCAFAQQPATDDTEIPASLACSVIAPHITPIVQGAGFYADVPDFAQQIEDACDAGSWSLALRQCFAAAENIDALHACLQPS